MCGIYGYIGAKIGTNEVLKRLQRLEYRGYDSCGIGYFDLYKNFNIEKSTSRISDLMSLKNEETSLAISHTRWATHGKISLNNTHPFTSTDQRYVLVHNGIIENINFLRDKYMKNICLSGDTDSEIIVNILSILQGNTLKKMELLTKILRGSFSILVVDKLDIEKIYFIKNKTPLLIVKENKGYSITSDLNVLSNDAYYHNLCDLSYGFLSNDKLIIKNDELDFKYYKLTENKYSDFLYSHYMRKEILEQAQVINNIKNKDYFKYKEILQNYNEFIIIGAGTSYYAGCYIKDLLQRYLNANVFVYIASEFAYNNINIKEKTLCMLLSQSGETADLIACIKKIGDVDKLLLTNECNSTLARLSDYVIDIEAKKEIAVASTKSYTAMIVVIYKIICDNDSNIDNLILCIKEVYEMEDRIKQLANSCKNYNKIFFIGRSIDYILTQEAALKVKELTYLHCEGFASGELKHGSIALVDDNTFIFCFISEVATNMLCRTNLLESTSRGAKGCVLSSKDISDETDDYIFKIDSDIANLSFIVFVQFFAYYLAIAKHYDVDKPRNLAKSVTVE